MCNCPLYIAQNHSKLSFSNIFSMDGSSNIRCQTNSRKNVNWNQNWAKKQLNILRNVMWLYSCGPPKVPTYRTKGISRASKKWVNSFFMKGRGFLHRIFSHTFYWWTWKHKKSPPNKQLSRTIYLADKKSAQKTRETLFFQWKPKLYFFGLVCCCLFSLLRCVSRKFHEFEWYFFSHISFEVVKYAKMIKINQAMNKHNTVSSLVN